MTMDVAHSRIERIAGTGMALRGNDIDTDQILPARFLTSITFDGMEAHAFADARATPGAAGKGHPFFDARFAGSSILVVNLNFGCGSSREHAPQALHRWGIEAIVGESFGEIFAGNCIAIGMPCVVVTAKVAARLQALIEETPGGPIELDLLGKSLTASDEIFSFDIGEGRRQQLIEGTWDATAVLLAAGEQIDRKMRALGYGDLLPHRP